MAKDFISDQEMQQILKTKKPQAAPTATAEMPDFISDEEAAKLQDVETPEQPMDTNQLDWTLPETKKKPGFIKSMAKDAMNTLVVRPATRIAQTVTDPILLSREKKNRQTQDQITQSKAELGRRIKMAQDPAEQARLRAELDALVKQEASLMGVSERNQSNLGGPTKVSVPVIGEYENKRPENIKQVAGEGLEAASYLVGGGGSAKVGQQVLKKTLGTAVKEGAKVGAKSGALFGAGNAMEEDKDWVDVAKEAAGGGIVGAGAGAAFPLAFHGANKLLQKTVNAPKNISNKVAETVEKMNRPEVVKKATSTGIDDNIVNFIRESAPEEKTAFRKMFDMAEKSGKDLRFREQPSQVAGQTILKRAEHLIKVKDMGVAQTNRVINSLDQRPKDVSGITLQFLKDLREKGVMVIKRGKGIQLVSNGKVPNGDLPFYREMYNLLQPDKSGKVMKTYRNLHQLRQRIFNELNLAKARTQPFSDDVASYGEHLRKLLADPLDQASKGKYRLTQRKTADALGTLREFVQLLGYKGDLEKLGTKDLRVGEVASRILGNASDRPMTVLQQLDDMAKKYGYKGKDSYLDQIQFADILESVFGTTKTRSLRGQVGKAGMDVVSETTGAVNDAASGNILGLAGRAIKHILGKSKDDQIRALKELLDFEVGNVKIPTVFGRKK